MPRPGGHWRFRGDYGVQCLVCAEQSIPASSECLSNGWQFTSLTSSRRPAAQWVLKEKRPWPDLNQTFLPALDLTVQTSNPDLAFFMCHSLFFFRVKPLLHLWFDFPRKHVTWTYYIGSFLNHSCCLSSLYALRNNPVLCRAEAYTKLLYFLGTEWWQRCL